MNLSKTLILTTILFLCSTTRLRAEFLSVIEITDLRGNTSFQVCTDEETRKLESELKAEAKAYPKALEETKADWKAVQKDTPFPGSRIKQRTLRVLTRTVKREEADAFLGKKQSREERELSKDQADEERILKMKPTRSRRGGSNKAAVEWQQKEVKEDRERDSNADKAEAVLRKKLSAAAGHEVPFFGQTPVEPQQKPAAKKK